MLVLGGYGHFGSRIWRALAEDATLIIAGRDVHKAPACASVAAHGGVALDYPAKDPAAHWVDLADGCAFVSGIAALDGVARQSGVLVASGASSQPALSSAVIDEHLGHFSRVDTIDISIAPGPRTPRGVATLEAVLSYCGKPFQAWEQGRWQTVCGWQDLHPLRYPEFGPRSLARALRCARSAMVSRARPWRATRTL
jgi:hypothetical protein